MSTIIERFTTWLHALICFTERNAWITIITTISSVLIFSLGTLKLTQIVSIEDQLDPQLTSTKDLKKSKLLFGGQSSFGFIVQAPKNGFTAGDLCLVKAAISRMERKYSEITNSMSIFDLRKIKIEKGQAYYPTLLTNVCLLDANEKVSLEFLKTTPWSHLLSGRELKDVSVILSLAPLDLPGKYGTFDPLIVEKLLKETKELIPLEIQYTGTSAQEYFTMIGLAEAQWINILAVLLIFFTFRIIFGKWRAGLVYFFTVMTSVVIVYGGMGWVGHAVDPLLVCLFLMLAVASLEDFIFVSHEMMKNELSWKECFKRVSVPCFFTSISAAAAFLSLSFSSDLITIQRFGAWAALGAMLEWMALFLLTPAVMKVLPRLGPWTAPQKALWQKAPLRWLDKTPPRFLSFLALGVFFSAFYSVQNFRLSQTPSEMFPKDHPFQQTIDFIKEDRGWVADAGLIFANNVSQEFKEKIRAIVKSDSLIRHIESWDKVVDFVSNQSSDVLVKQMVARELGITKMSQRYLSASGEERDILYLKTTNTAEVNRFRQTVEGHCPARECWLAGEFIGFADFSKGLIHTLFESMVGSVLSVGFIVAILGVLTGHVRQVPGLVLASFWGPAMMLTAIFLCDISINFVTCIVASTLIGLTGDNAIMFMFQGETIKEGIEQHGLGSLQTSLVMSLCSLTFVLSYFEPPRMLGILLAGGFLCSLLGDVWLLKGLMKKND
jgi:predicted RND superfamily exporter protein